MVRLGVCLLRDGTPEHVAEGRGLLEVAADLGDPEAKNNLATMHAGGHGGLALDAAKAHTLYLEAAADGCADAMFNLGAMHDRGEAGVAPQDASAAAHWFVQAAEKNHFEAAHALALMEVAGRGVAVDIASASRRLAKLAHPSVTPPYPNAPYLLGLVALKGQLPPGIDVASLLPDPPSSGSGGVRGSDFGGGSGRSGGLRSGDGGDDPGGVRASQALGVRLLARAAGLGHAQAKDQLEALLTGVPEDQRRALFSGNGNGGGAGEL